MIEGEVATGEGAATQRQNHHGQRIGSKGERTRQALIETTVRLLEEHGLREVSVADVARAAKTSPATFYVYFRGVPEVVLAALESVPQSTPRLEALMDRDWLGPGGDAAARALVDEYTAVWARNRTIFRVRNLAAEEGDIRFHDARLRAARPTMDGLSFRVALAQAAGRVPPSLDPRACIGTILMMLERLSATGPLGSGRGDSPDFESLKDAAAYSISRVLGA